MAKREQRDQQDRKGSIWLNLRSDVKSDADQLACRVKGEDVGSHDALFVWGGVD